MCSNSPTASCSPDGALLDRLLQVFLAEPQRLLRLLPSGDLLREDEQAADPTRRAKPGLDLPAHPLTPAIGALEQVFFGRLDPSTQAPPMHLFPALGNLREDLVMGAPDQVLV